MITRKVKKEAKKTAKKIEKESRILKRDSKSRVLNVRVRFSKKALKAEILKEAKVLNRHMGAAEAIADRVVLQVEKWVAGRNVVTKNDIDRVTCEKIKKYDPDLAYIYKNRGKII